MDFGQFSDIIRRSPFEPRVLELTPFDVDAGKPKLTKRLYKVAFRLAVLHEFLASFILLIADKA